MFNIISNANEILSLLCEPLSALLDLGGHMLCLIYLIELDVNRIRLEVVRPRNLYPHLGSPSATIQRISNNSFAH
jgi:hypothetical protein